MFRSLKTNFLFLISLAFLCSFTSAVLTQCNTSNRPDPSTCQNQTASAHCGYYTVDCPLVVCGINAFNRCAACSQPNILYTRDEECEPGDLVQKCSNTTCNPENDPQQPFIYDPVCGVKRVHMQGVVETTYENVCQLCENSDHVYYKTGTCQNDRHYCKEDPSCDSDDATENNEGNEEGTEEQSDPVCAYFTSDAVGSVYTTVASGWEACQDESVEYWTKGACGNLRNNITYCLPNSRPEMCYEIFAPVCGFFHAADGSTTSKDLSNDCFACADPTILWYQPGPCISDCAGYRTRPEDLQDVIENVCGYTAENCTSEDCRANYDDQYDACANSDVLNFSRGPCL